LAFGGGSQGSRGGLVTAHESLRVRLSAINHTRCLFYLIRHVRVSLLQSVPENPGPAWVSGITTKPTVLLGIPFEAWGIAAPRAAEVRCAKLA